MIRRLLIANRGEIAVRIARTARRLGIETVAVYSDADRHALHVEVCDHARHLGPPEPVKSYLSIEKLVAAAKASGADAVHPGYGFLSEKADFAEACEKAGLVFVGPNAKAIRAMGSKERSRELALRLGVPIVPGYQGAAQDDASLAREAERIGWPLMVKASAGGGGKGIRVVHAARELAAAIATARREATSAFGDGTLILERYVERARHVEVQLLGDRHGTVTTILDRECSIQRNHQKLVEEAPAPRLPDAVRRLLHDSARKLAAEIAYDSAGTAEFLLDDETDQAFFLEMNTRLQVEHPTTELVTGLDLVELQLRVASGEKLPRDLRSLAANGWAIEARLCAERPEEGFLPATGTIARFEVPPIEGLRVESGIRAGSVVSPTYDSMLAKVIAHGRDREEARARLVAALGGLVLAGVENNADYLREVVDTEAFRSARVSTRFLEQELRLAAPDEASSRIDLLAAAVARVLAIEASYEDRPSPWKHLGPWRVTRHSGRTSWTPVVLRENGEDRTIRLAGFGGSYRVGAEGSDDGSSVTAWLAADGALRLETEGALHRRLVVLQGADAWVSGGARRRRLAIVSRDEQVGSKEGAAGDARSLKAPFPGLVTSVEVAAGAEVERGAVLVVMEAMKMVHSLRAAGAGVVKGIHCAPGQTVDGGALLVDMEGVAS